MERLPRNTRKLPAALEELRYGKRLRFRPSQMIISSAASRRQFINKSAMQCLVKWRKPLHWLLLNISKRKKRECVTLMRYTFPFFYACIASVKASFQATLIVACTSWALNSSNILSLYAVRNASSPESRMWMVKSVMEAKLILYPCAKYAFARSSAFSLGRSFV